jgi:site-specific recombinase XerD
MLKQLVKNPSTLQFLRASRWRLSIDSFASSLLDLGYAESTVQEQLRLIVELVHWLDRRKIQVADLDEEVVGLFIDGRRHEGHLRRGERHTACRFVEHVREKGLIPAARVHPEESLITQLERSYESYLRVERGLTTATVDRYQRFVRRFLIERFGEGPLRVNDLCASDISDFVVRHARSMSPRTAQLMGSALRSFLRFLLQHGKVERDLAVWVPTVAAWRLSTVPKYLEREEVERLLKTCDRGSPMGRRDYAILLLLARLGLRAGEVAACELEDLDWRGAEITIRGKGLIHQRLPLLAEVGEALALYLCQDRPTCQTRQVFLRRRAPRRGLAASAVSTIVRRALERAGLQTPCKGAHLLRHSLATGLLHEGASLAEIGEVLRHRLVSTTEIYAKVDLDRLRRLAQPWPGKGGQP